MGLKHILIVEDEPIIAMAEKKNLEKMNYKVSLAHNDKTTLSSLDNIDLILMDIDLGRFSIDGTELAQQILNIKNIPIVFLSSHTDIETVEKTEKITSYGYVVKNSGIVILDTSIKMAFKLFEEKEKVKQQLTEKEMLIREAHHRIKNNLTSIISLINLETMSLKNKEAKLIVEKVINQIKSISLIYDKLLHSTQYNSIEIKNYFKELISLIIHAFQENSIYYNISVIEKTLPVKIVFPLSIIANELITNSMKYAFENLIYKHLYISIDIIDNNLIFIIADNGIGYIQEETDGFGLKLVNMLVDELKGTIQIINNNGTENVITIPLD